MRRAVSVALLLLTALSGSVPHAAAQVSKPDAGSVVIAAVPGSRETTYATPVAFVEPGDDLTFVNLEPFPHTVRSVETGPDDGMWCGPPNPDEPTHKKRNPRRFPKGKCPLLWTPPIALTNGVVTTKVYGTKNLESGTSVEFYCTVFPNMKGTLIVI
jgi:plastocyanin